ncbi:MAG: TonB-dependent receptor plug domain-containing protein, partial [Cyclobacteriaceae bacterium]
TYQMGINNSVTGLGTQGNAIDYSVNFNTSFVADDHKSGIAIYGFTRNRGMYDANNDGLSEISPMNNLTVGTRFFYRFGHRNKMTFDFFNIKEEREGGNMQDRPLHEREVAEAVGHDLKSAALTFEQYTGKNDLLSIYVSSQFLDRDSYYGANYSLADYGNSKDNTYNMGAHYKANLGNSSLVAGVENTSSLLKDEKLGFPDYENAQIVNDTILSVPHTGNTLVADQSSISTGIFAQYELKYKKFKMTLGGRYDYYEIKDYTKEDNALKSGNVFSPRVSVLYEIHKNLKARASYSQGYRAPQIFDEDLHIETSRIRKVINVNDPGLKKETSHSFMTSLDFNGLIGTIYTGLLVESFYTRLLDPFVNKIGVPDENGVVKYLRKNADDGATVKGINIELKLKPLEYFTFNSGFTFQSSVYDVAQEFDEKRFPRTPNHYGFFAVDWDFYKNFCLSTTGNYTGNMLVPYFGPGTDPDNGELRKSGNFFDSGVKLKYNIELKGVTIQCFGGLKNIFNSYQKDFDSGPDRDPAYMYGPVAPRTLYLGVKFGNLLD